MHKENENVTTTQGRPYHFNAPALQTLHSEEKLVALMKSGAPECLEILYQMYSRALLSVIVKLIRDRPMAEDTLQLVWLKVWPEVRNYDPQKGRVYTWLLNIARNAAIDTCRSRAYKLFQKNLSFDDYPEYMEQFKSNGLNIDTIGLREFVAQLEEKQREILELVYFQGYTQLEAAKQLGIPLGTLKTWLRAAIKNLGKFFYEDGVWAVPRRTTKRKRSNQLSSYKSVAEIRLAMEIPNELSKLKGRVGRPKNPIVRTAQSVISTKNPLLSTKKHVGRSENPVVRAIETKKASVRLEVIRLYRLKTMGMSEIASSLGIKLSTAFYYTKDLPKNGSLRQRKADTSALPPPKPLKPRIYEMALKIKQLHDLKTMTHTQIGAQLGISSMKVGRYLFALNRWEAYQKEKKI
ncbi:RNA polymerase sigma factor [Pedobacter sp. GR22-6]|uniref:RNA polymerase sigma factor n=1 Tax=Pedobacter sp. GR22-6 TaxID=3127957 RepID=UPI00307D2CE1